MHCILEEKIVTIGLIFADFYGFLQIFKHPKSI